MKATQLQEMQSARIIAIHLTGVDAKRLFYLGIYLGAVIQFIHKAPLHDPYLFFVQGSYVILRKQDAQHIEVEL